MNTRAKLVCTKVSPSFSAGGEEETVKTQETIEFETRYNAADSAEDNSYSKYTPSASMRMVVTNERIFGSFEEGKAYYFDISPAN